MYDKINIIHVPTRYISVCVSFSLLFQHEKEVNEVIENEIEGARIDFVVSDTCVCVCVLEMKLTTFLIAILMYVHVRPTNLITSFSGF